MKLNYGKKLPLCDTILGQAEKELVVPYNAASKATPPRPTKKSKLFSAGTGLIDYKSISQDVFEVEIDYIFIYFDRLQTW